MDGLTPSDGRRAIPIAALVLGAAAMGASPIFVRLADVGPFASAFWRTFLALPFLWAWMRLAAREGDVDAPRSVMLPIALAGVFFAGDLFFWHLSILATTVANATFLATTAPIWVVLTAWLLRSERISIATLVGLALCIAGGAALVGQSYGFAPQRLLGDAFGLATAGFFGLYVVALRFARKGCGAARLSFISTAITSACLLVVALALDTAFFPQSWSGAAVLVALALISQVGGQGLLAVALGALPATFSSMVIFLEAVAAAAFAWVILGEALGWLQALGAILILGGIFLARPREQATESAA